MKKHHRIAADVKADILRRVKEEGVSMAQAAKDHGISEGTIYGWMVTGATGAPSWAEFSRLQKQNRELLELVGEITLKLSMAQKNSCGKEETKQRLPEPWAYSARACITSREGRRRTGASRFAWKKSCRSIPPTARGDLLGH
jgi:transposase-like protein